MATLLPPTQDVLKEEYLDLAKAADPTNDIDTFADFNNKGTVIGGVVAGASQDAYGLYNNLYPQFANGQGINFGLAAAGVPVTFPATQAQLTLDCTDYIESGQTYNVPIGTIVTAPNGATYKVISSTNSNLVNVIITTVNPLLYVVSNATGQNTGQLVDVILTITPPIVSVSGSFSFSQAKVTASTDGATQETITDATNRLVNIKQIPLCGTRKTDFKYLAIDPTNTVIDAVVLINNQLIYTDETWNVGIYDVSGSPINNTILNKGLLTLTAEVFDRTTLTGPIADTQAVMDSQDIVGAFPIVNTVSTQQITALTGSPNPFLKVVVTLQFGYTLETQVTLPEGTFTVKQLVQREVRRAVCSQPFGAALTTNDTSGAFTSSFIPISSIEQQIDLALGTATTVGTIGSYLSDRTVYVYNGGYVYQPTIPLSLSLPVADGDALGWVYDISTNLAYIYPNIAVVLS